jgi:microcystin-dependent protein
MNGAAWMKSGRARRCSLVVILALAVMVGVFAGGQASARPTPSSHEGRCDWLAQVMLDGFHFANVGTADPHGQLLHISHHNRLYSLFGNTFGGNPNMDTFGLPNLQGKAPAGLHYNLCTTGSYPSPASEGGQCPFLGQIVLTAYAGAFNGAVAAHGELLSTANHPGLFSLYGYKFGGSQASGRFGVPNLQGKAPPGLSYRVCTTGFYPLPDGGAGRCNWLGQVMLFGFDVVPLGTIPAAGQQLMINRDTALFSLYSTTYGGNGTTTFGIPNLHGKAPTGLHYRVCTRGAFPSRF